MDTKEVNFPFYLDLEKPRNDITELPCLVFKNKFIQGATNIRLALAQYQQGKSIEEIFQLKNSPKLAQKELIIYSIISYGLGGFLTLINPALFYITTLILLLIITFPFYWPYLKKELNKNKENNT